MPNTDEYIIYFGHFELPDKNALAHRILANARIFRALGYRVILVGYSREIGEPFAAKGDDIFEVKYPKTKAEWLNDFKSYRHIEAILRDNDPKRCRAVVATGVGAGNYRGLLSLSKKYAVPLVSDIVDWVYYVKGNLTYNAIKFGLDYLACAKLLQGRVKNKIYISTRLAEKYPKCHSVVIPSLTYRDDPRFRDLPPYSAGENTRICYVGNPGRRGMKDRVDWCVKAFLETAPAHATMDIYGVSKEIFTEDFPEIALDERVTFHGLCENAVCVAAIARADFFVFAREDTEITRCGFPTKYAEACAIGTPVVTTPTSDLRQYLHDGQNGFIAAAISYESFRAALNKVWSLSREQREKMHGAPSPLDESLWRDAMKDFLDTLK